MRSKITVLRRILFSWLASFFFLMPVSADMIEYACSIGDVSRHIALEYPNYPTRVPCLVWYDKTEEGAGKKILWRADGNPGFCENKTQLLIQKLSRAGYNCSLTSGTDLLASTESNDKNSVAPSPATAPLAKSAPLKKLVPTTKPQVTKKAKTGADHAHPKSRVDSYLHWLSIRARENNRDARTEMAAIKVMGLDTFYDEWASLFQLIELDEKHKAAWSIESIECGTNSCKTWLIDEGASRDAQGYYQLTSIGALEGRLSGIISCVAFEGDSRCYPGDRRGPISTYRFDTMADGHYSVYEFQFGGYAKKFSCDETLVLSGENKDWHYSIDVFNGARQNPPIQGDGDCKTRVLKEYWKKL